MNKSSNNNSEILVSVNMITYNHEPFIAQAIEGVLMQETNFRYELVIANDCSPDNTDAIVKHYISNHPKGNNIKYFRHNVNIGMQANGIFASEKCVGKYIATCEGDDYWIDSNKLQKQINLLEQNTKCSACITLYKVLDSKENKLSEYKHPILKLKDEFNSKDVIENWFTQTSTLVFKKEIINNYPDFFKIYPIDLTLLLLITLHGNIKLLPEYCSVYRSHEKGISKVYNNLKHDLKSYNLRKKVFCLFNDITGNNYYNSIKYNLNYTLWNIKLKFNKNTFIKIIITLQYILKIRYFSKYNFKSNILLTFPFLNTFKNNSNV